MSLTRLGQYGRKKEATSGVEETLAAADYRGNIREVGTSVSINRFERSLKRPTLTPDPTLAGSRSGQVTLMEEFGPGGSASVASPSASTLEGMGFRQHAVYKLTLASAVPTAALEPRPGQRVYNASDFATATKSGTIAHVVGATIWVTSETGSAWTTSDTLYSVSGPQQGSGANTPWNRTISAVVAGGFGYRPFSETYETVGGGNVATVMPPSLTMEDRNNGQRRTFIGCRGTGQIQLRRNEPPMLSATFTGVPVVDSGTGTWRSGGRIDNVPRLPAPPVFVNSKLTMIDPAGVAYAPVFTEFTVDLGNEVTLRETAGVSLAESGFVEARITGRQTSASLNPEVPADSVYSLPKSFFEGSPFMVIASCGSLTHPCGLLVFVAPQAQFNSDLSMSDRGGIETVDASVRLSGDEDREVLIFQVF